MCYGTLCLRCLMGATERWWSEGWGEEEGKKKRRDLGGGVPFYTPTAWVCGLLDKPCKMRIFLACLVCFACPVWKERFLPIWASTITGSSSLPRSSQLGFFPAFPFLSFSVLRHLPTFLLWASTEPSNVEVQQSTFVPSEIEGYRHCQLCGS